MARWRPRERAGLAPPGSLGRFRAKPPSGADLRRLRPPHPTPGAFPSGLSRPRVAALADSMLERSPARFRRAREHSATIRRGNGLPALGARPVRRRMSNQATPSPHWRKQGGCQRGAPPSTAFLRGGDLPTVDARAPALLCSAPMPLDPQARLLLDQMASMGTPPLHTMSVPDARAMMESMNGLLGQGEAVTHVEDRDIPGPAGRIPTRLYRPEGSAPLPLLVYFHGGGWVLGGLASHDVVCRSLANASGCAVLAIDYRLAPEH